MSAPNPDDPLDNAVAETWKNREAEALQNGWWCIFVLNNILVLNIILIITYLNSDYACSSRMDS